MENRDEKLWQLASQRAGFKGKVISYIAANIFFWAIWFFTSRNNEHMHMMNDYFIPWPAWITIGWGFGLIMRYVRIFHTNSADQIQKEYDKLKR